MSLLLEAERHIKNTSSQQAAWRNGGINLV